MPDDPWETIEGKFRLWSFHIYYQRSFANERDLLARFVKAILASAQPIRDRQLVLDWYAQRRCNRKNVDSETLPTAGH